MDRILHYARILIWFIFALLLSACQSSNGAEYTRDQAVITASSTLTMTPSPPPTSTPFPTNTPTPTELPEVAYPQPDPVSRPEGKVLIQASCRYGPGAAYLFEWGLFPGDYVWILYRNLDGKWVYVKPLTYNNECWVKTEFLEVTGDIQKLVRYYSALPQGYLYKPVHYVAVQRHGNMVELQWDAVWMTEDDDRGYLIEAWVCRNGRFVFEPINFFPYTKNFGVIRDDAGCRQRSHARIFTVEKHGYMFPPTSIDWPNLSGNQVRR